mgnify:FL=1
MLANLPHFGMIRALGYDTRIANVQQFMRCLAKDQVAACTEERSGDTMKQGIHPEYNDIKATCTCGNVIETRSTMKEDIHLDVCSACHPFYTGQQKVVDTGGRIDKFKKRFGAVRRSK